MAIDGGALFACVFAIYYTIKIFLSVLWWFISWVFWTLDFLVSVLKFCFSWVPFIFSIVTWGLGVIVSVFSGIWYFGKLICSPFAFAFDKLTDPVLRAVSPSKNVYNSVNRVFDTVFSYVFTWIIVLTAVLFGIAGMQKLFAIESRAKKIVPIFCIIAGCAMHYGKEGRFSDGWIPTIAVASGIAWYALVVYFDRAHQRRLLEARRHGGPAARRTSHHNHPPAPAAAQPPTGPQRLQQSESGTVRVLGTETKVFLERQCFICLEDIGHDTIVRVQPCCKHCGHEECIADWRRRGNNTCPYCRAPQEGDNAGFLVHALFQ
jgi:hypothetical protein